MLHWFIQFLQRGFSATFSYHSWQVPAHNFLNLSNASLVIIFLFLGISVFL